MLRKDNEKSRTSLEASLKEYTLVTKALQALGVDIEDEDMMGDINDSALVDPKEVSEKKENHKADEKSVQPEHKHVTFSSKNQETIIHTVDEHRGEKEKRRFTKEKSRAKP